MLEKADAGMGFGVLGWQFEFHHWGRRCPGNLWYKVVVQLCSPPLPVVNWDGITVTSGMEITD